MRMYFDRIQSPIGEMMLVWEEIDGEGSSVRALEFGDHEERFHRTLRRQYPAVELVPASAPEEVSAALERYFAGDLSAIDQMRAEASGTAFQRKVWAELRKVPPGTTLSYGELAGRIGNADACRAVGLANGSNPIAIIVPCHRVIGSNGSLTGYGGGVERKRWLLAHEGVTSRLLLPASD